MENPVIPAKWKNPEVMLEQKLKKNQVGSSIKAAKPKKAYKPSEL